MGAGGHARVVADALRASGARVIGFADAHPSRAGETLDGIAIRYEPEALAGAAQERVWLAIGVGCVGDVGPRQKLHERLAAGGWRIATVIHPAAVVSPFARIESAAQIMAGAIVQAGAVVGVGTIVNTGAVVDHDCLLG